MGPDLRAATLLWLKTGERSGQGPEGNSAEPPVFPYVIQLMSDFNVIPLCMYEGL